MISKIFISILLILVLIGCRTAREKQNNSFEQKDITFLSHNSQNRGAYSAPMWVGIYDGIQFAQHCEEIKITVELRKNNTFLWVSEYLSNKKKKFRNHGEIIINEKGRILVLKQKSGEKKFRFNGSTLIPLGNIKPTNMCGTSNENSLTKRKTTIY
ncbi:copper resistance protein NlpE N-terminal domain-containing protein [Elizabethkingia anophelis]|uniref:copper resistance protein NlpE N-terminal domain-containing protein n=1 Tax=Elizabethkingia anophelis TaxID=1117645 RepID=UPI003F19A1A2|nr:copper resistance protein NlpE N-terminal domain-containing protein [Elizabethkingia anophelis]MCT3813754.1 copper resistance protein NlpE N-terminal domain-containing protein [Elizabethkingia anophelis]MCT3820848.1 copper resistance protein NlpE N-terminal domain-containing protein [Elizabethkingia anophelis]